jgi:hypothetical protein
MKYMIWITAVSVVLGVFCISSASARDAVIIIKAAGENYEGPPNLRLLADGQLIGERTLVKSIETASGRKTTKTERIGHAEWLKFVVPAVEGVAKLEIEFNNDASAGKGKAGDRNLYIYGLFIDGYPFRPKSMTHVPASSGGTWGDEALIWSNGRLQLSRPKKGWKSGYKAATPSN